MWENAPTGGSSRVRITLPFGKVWDAYCEACGKPVDGAWLPRVLQYEKDVQEARG